jgi:hypothetical protein
MKNKEWVVFRVNGVLVSCESRAEWDDWKKRNPDQAPYDHLELLATGLTKQQATQMTELANGD